MGKWTNQFIAWASIAGRPSAFTPVQHSHIWDEITDAPAGLPPSAHTHAWAELTDVPLTFTPSVHTHLWAEITDRPLTFPPEPHDHAGLYYNRTELGTSGAGGQVHWDNITGKPETFGTGDMLRADYDTDDDGVVESADFASMAGGVAWADIVNTPADFPPSAHTHDDRYFTEVELTTSGGGGSVHWDNIAGRPSVFGSGDMEKSVYDRDDDGIVDVAASVPWSGITGRPAAYTPSAHQHDDMYSLLGHDHNDLYSLPGHNHDDSYSVIGHGHSHTSLSDTGTNSHAQIDSHIVAAAPHAGHLTNAPSNGTLYGRRDGGWVEAGGTQNVREMLTASRTYYVRSDGSDSNNGLSNTAGGAFLTIQRAIDVVSGTLDTSVYDVTIQLASGTYAGSGNILKQCLGAGTVTILGNEATPANVVVSVGSSQSCFTADTIGTIYHLRGMKLSGSSSQFGIAATAATIKFQNMEFGSTFIVQIRALAQGFIMATGDYRISGGSSYHMRASRSGVVQTASAGVVLVNNPAFTTYAQADELAEVSCYSQTFSGTATGSRYYASNNSVIFTNGAPASYLPGNTSGTTATGGIYV